MKIHTFKNFITKVTATLLLVALLATDSTVAVFAEPFTEQEPEIIIESTDDETPEPEVYNEELEEVEITGISETDPAPEEEDDADLTETEGENTGFEIVDLGSRFAQTADGAPGDVRTSDFNAFSDKSRTDFYHKFYNQLSDREKRIYSFFEDNAEDFIKYSYDPIDVNDPFAFYFTNGETESSTNIVALQNQYHKEVLNAIGCFMWDHPEVFWIDINKIDFKYSYNGETSGSTVYFDMFRVEFSMREKTEGSGEYYDSMLLDRYEKDTKEEAYAKVRSDKGLITGTINLILNDQGYPSGGSIGEKAGFINDKLTYINYYNRYVYDALNRHVKDDEGRYPHVAPSALNNRTLTWLTEGGMGAHEAPVCESYAYGFKVVCDAAGIPCIVVSGNDHMWNYVQEDDGVWYAVDVTWDDPVRDEEYYDFDTDPDQIRAYCMVGSSTKCDGTSTFASEHPANSAYVIGGKVPSFPTISTEEYNYELLGAKLSCVDTQPTVNGGVINAEFNTNKTGRYYWVVREHDDTQPDIYDIQDGVVTVPDGAGSGVVSATDAPVTLTTSVLAPGYYDLYIMQLSGHEYISNVISYSNIKVSSRVQSITLHDIKADASKGVPRQNTLYVSSGIPVTYTIEPEELADEVAVTLSTSNEDKVKINGSNLSVWGNQEGYSYITATAKYTDEDGNVQKVVSDRLKVYVVYPPNRIFDKYGRKYYATSETELYTGWLVEKNGICTPKDDTPNIDYELTRGANVYYFDPDEGGEHPENKYKAVKGGQHIGHTDYLFGNDGKLIKVWLKLKSIAINNVPADANQSGPIDVNTLSYGASVKLTAVCNPGRTTDDLNPVWTSSDPSVRVTPAGKEFTIHQGGDIWELYATIDVLRLPEDPTEPVIITVKAGQETPNNRKTGTIDIFVTRPVGWQTISGRTYYGKIVESGDRKQVEFVKGWWPNDFEHRNEAEKEYFFDDAGVMAKGLVDLGNKIFDFGHDGVLRGEYEKTGFMELANGTFYYDGGIEPVKNAIVTDEIGNHFFMDASDGHMVTDQWIEYTPNGSSITHYLYADTDGKLADGLTRINGKKYFFNVSNDADAVPCSLCTGMWFDIDGADYYFYEDDTDYKNCFMATGYFCTGADPGRKYYYALPEGDKKAGQLQSGWVYVGETEIDGIVIPTAWKQFSARDAAEPYSEITSDSRGGWIRMSDGTRYYRNQAGVQVTGWQTIDGNKYFFNPDGSVATGLVQIPAITGSRYCFGETDDFEHPENDNYGKMLTGRVTTGGNSYFFNSSGIMVTGWQKGASWDYYDQATGEALNAVQTEIYGDNNWYTIGSARFYVTGGTTPATGWQTIDGYRFYFNPGANAAGVTGQMSVGVTTIGSAKYYFRETDEETRMGDLLTGHGYAKGSDGKQREYLANSNGVLQLGWQKAGGEWAFFDYEKGYALDDVKIGTDNWVIAEEGVSPAPVEYYKYYLKNGTTPVTGKQTINGKTYFFGTDTADGRQGRLRTGFFKEGKYWYYGTPYDSTTVETTEAGRLQSGFVNVGGITRFFNSAFEMQTGWILTGGEWHYFLTEADVAQGGIAEGDPIGKEIGMTKSFEWYKGTDAPFLDMYFCFKGGSSLLKGWQSVNGYRYYFDPENGMLITGVQKIANSWYDLGGVFADHPEGMIDGYAKTGWSDGDADSSDYYYGTSGARVTGWQTIDNRKYYFRPQGAGEDLDGTEYGKKYKNTILSVGNDRFVLGATAGEMLTGYCGLGGKQYYTNTNGVMQYGWQIINGTAHYFRLSSDPTDPGAEDDATPGGDNLINAGGETYYLKNGTTMTVGFADIAGNRYYFDETNSENRGRMYKNVWFFYKNKKYYAYPDGHLAKGYCEGIGANDYMFGNDHILLTGIQTVNGRFMFFDPDADPQTVEYGARKAYTEANGIAGFFKTADGTIFYVKNGKIQTGWQEVEGRRYYFDATGVLQASSFGGGATLYDGEFLIGSKIYRSYTQAEADESGTPALRGGVYSGFKNYENGGSRWTCYYDANGLRASGWVEYDNEYYYFDPDDGKMRIGCFTVGNYMYFSDKTGRRLTGFVNYNNNTYFCDGKGIAKSGWQTIRVDGENRKFWFDENGVMATEVWKIGSSYYYFQDVPGMIQGQMRTGFFAVENGGRKYSYNANSSGVLQFGPAENNGDWLYYAGESDNVTYSDSIDIGAGYAYELYDANKPNWYKVTFNDVVSPVLNRDYILLYATKGNNPLKGWQTVKGLDGNNHKYYFNPSNGAMMTGRITVSGKEYQLGDDPDDLSTLGTFSAETTGFTSFDGGNTWYYFDANAMMVTGWVNRVFGPRDTQHEAGEGSFYLDPNENGKLATGLTVIGKNTYFLENRPSRNVNYGKRVDSEVVDVGTDYYIFGANGAMLTGWQNVNDNGDIKKQYFAPNLQEGTEYTDKSGTGRVYVLKIANNMYRLDDQAYAYRMPQEANYTKGFDPIAGIYQDSSSKIITGLQTITVPNNKRVSMYFSPENGIYVSNDFVTVGNKTYYFDNDGAMVTGKLKAVGADHFLFGSNGVMLTGWQKCPNGEWGLFDTNTGKQITGTHCVYSVSVTEGWYEYTDVSGRIVRYYLRNGKPLTGWQSVNTIYGANHEKGKFYFNPDGTVAYSDNGEFSVSNVNYYSQPYKGAGGVVIPDRDYGRMVSGFYASHGGYRYADSNGKMVTGWLTLTRPDEKKYKYYLSADGMLCTGVTDVSGSKYYLKDYSDAHADHRDPVTYYEYGALQLSADGVIHSENPLADYRVNSSGVLQSGWVFIKNGAGYVPEYYSTDIDTFGQNIPVTAKTDGAATPKRTDWYEMEGKWYLIEGGKTLRKGNFNQNVIVNGVKTPLLFALDPTTGALNNTEGIFSIGNNRYYNTAYTATTPTGYPDRAIKVNSKFSAGGRTYFADASGVLKTGFVSEKREDKVTYLGFYSPTDCAQFKGGMFTYGNSVYYSYTDDDEAAHRIPAGYTVGDLAKDRVTLLVDGTESDYLFDSNGVRKCGWASFKDANDGKTYKYYYNTDGRKVFGGLFTIDGKDYVFDNDGKLYTDKYQPTDGSRYCFDGSGSLYRGWKYLKDPATNVSTWRYYRRSDGKEITPAGIDANNKMLFVPANKPGNCWVVVKEAGVVSAYYMKSGSGPVKNSWFEADNKRYFADADGVLCSNGTAMEMVSGPDGTALEAGFDVNVMTVGSDRFAVMPVTEAALQAYSGGEMPVGYAVSGFVAGVSTDLYYANSNGRFEKGDVTLKRNNVNWKYYADSNFRILTGPAFIGNSRYLFDTRDNYGRLLSNDHSELAGADGLFVCNGKKYLTDRKGEILTGWQYVTGLTETKWHYFDLSTGEEKGIHHWAGDWAVMSDGKVYHLANQKTLTKGFASIYGTYKDHTDEEEHLFFFDPVTGELMKAPDDEFIAIENGGYTYEADDAGTLTVGWGRKGRNETERPNIEADSWYDRDGRMVKGFATVTGDSAGYYYFDNNGKMATGLTWADGKLIMFGSNTTKVTEQISEISYDRGKIHKDYYGRLDSTANRYKSNDNGVVMTGWQYFKNGTYDWHYFDFNDYTENMTATWDADHNWCTLVLNENGKDITARYYFRNNTLLKGFQEIGEKKYFFDDTGRMATGLWNISGGTYYFGDDGVMLSNGITNSGGKYYFMDGSGKSKKGWFTISGSKYYADPTTGELAVGVVRIDGKNYFFSDADATLGQMQTGFIRISDFGQKYYDRNPGASNTYYADTNGVLAEPGWMNFKPRPKDPDPQEWSYYLAPNLPGIDMGDFTLAGEMAVGDVLIDGNGDVWYLDDGIGDGALGHDGYEIGEVYSGGTTTAEDIEMYYRFDNNTGARRKEVLYFYGNYYGMDIDSNQTRTINTMRCYANTDMKFSTPSDDFIIVNNYKNENDEQVGDNSVLVRKDLTSYPAATFPMCASKNIDEEKDRYVAANDLNQNDIVDVIDTEIYSKDVYDHAIVKYGPQNLVLMGASSGAGICLGLYDYAIGKNDEKQLPAYVLLMSPWIEMSMKNPKCKSISSVNSGPTDVGTLKYWGERYTRSTGTSYSFASSVNLRRIKDMKNVIMFTGSYDPCSFDCLMFADIAKANGNTEGVRVKNHSGEQHGFMFFAADKNAVNVTVEVCRKVMTQ